MQPAPTPRSAPIAARPATWRGLLVLAMLFGVPWLWFTRADETPPVIAPAPREGAPAPPFVATTTDGTALALDDLRGQVIVLNLWATWCPPCRREMPALQAVWERHQDEGLVVLALNQGESTDTVTDFAREYDLTFPLALDPGGAIGATYRLTAYPTTFFIGRDGVIRHIVYGGPMPEALIDSHVRDLLAE